MKNWKSFLKLPILLAAMSSVHAISAQSPPPPTSSAPSSPTSATPASKPIVGSGVEDDRIISACAATADDLAASRTLINALENENAALKTRLDTEKHTTALLTELNETRKSETDAVRTALAAKSETLTAKDAVIATQDKLIETLKRKKSSPWKRIRDVLIGAALVALFK